MAPQQRALVRIVQVKGVPVQRGLVSDLLDGNVFELLFRLPDMKPEFFVVDVACSSKLWPIQGFCPRGVLQEPHQCSIAFLEPCCKSGIRTDVKRALAAVAFLRSINRG